LTPLTPGVHPGGQNIAYDPALVKLGPHAKFGEYWSNGVDFYSGHTHTHTHTNPPGFNFIYKISPRVIFFISPQSSAFLKYCSRKKPSIFEILFHGKNNGGLQVIQHLFPATCHNVGTLPRMEKI
jgi:hypothetical protein